VLIKAHCTLHHFIISIIRKIFMKAYNLTKHYTLQYTVIVYIHKGTACIQMKLIMF